MRRNDHGGFSSITMGTRHVDDNWRPLAFFLMFGGGEGAEKEVAGVGHDGGSARRDAVLGLEK
jgi:hypothetical protein